MLNIFDSYQHDSHVIIELLKKLQIKVTNRTVNETLKSHPDYPSMLSISDCLKKWKINNAVIKANPEILAKIPYPCISYTKTSNFIIIDKIDKKQVYYSNWKGHQTVMLLSDFLEIWSGVLLLIETNEQSGEISYQANLKKERNSRLFWWILLLFPFLLSLFAVSNHLLGDIQDYNFCGFFLTIFLKSLGVVVSILLLWHEIDKNNPILQQICSGGKKVNCDAILNSKASQVFRWLSWSEVGFFYFTGGLLSLIFSGVQTTHILIILAGLNIMALPYTIFSIFYQWKIAKQWCVLCLTVQVLLIAEFLVSWSSGTIDGLKLIFDSLPATLVLFFSTFLLPIIVWYAIKPQLLAAQQGKRDFVQLQRIKYNLEIFQTLLQKQKQITVKTKGLGITIGNPDANIHLIKVCNPYCVPCAKAHKIIDDLLKKNTINVQIIFTVTSEEKDYRALPVKHLLAIAARNDETTTKKALDSWYGAKEKNYELFAKQYPLSHEELNHQIIKIEAMKTWCDEVNIEFTPSIFINGYLLPDAYLVEDLKYFLEE